MTYTFASATILLLPLREVLIAFGPLWRICRGCKANR
jgi:hypothetical protein